MANISKTWAEFSRQYDLHRGGKAFQAQANYDISQLQQYILNDPYIPSQFGCQHGSTHDPLQWGTAFGIPVQGYNNQLNGQPIKVNPNWNNQANPEHTPGMPARSLPTPYWAKLPRPF